MPVPIPPDILAVTVHDTYLYAVSKSGYLLPLYYYGPADVEPGQKVQDTPFVDDWPDYARDFVLSYYPLPELSNEKLPDDIEQKFEAQQREQSHLRPWAQAVYGGYPVYIYGDGSSADPATLGDPKASIKHLFRRVPQDLSGGPITGTGGVTRPPAELGP